MPAVRRLVKQNWEKRLPGNGSRKLDVDLDPVAGGLILVALPAPVVAFVALRGGQSAHAEAVQDAQDPGLADGQAGAHAHDCRRLALRRLSVAELAKV
jgi:hypothetical protein